MISELCNGWSSEDEVSIVSCLDAPVAYALRPRIKHYGLIPYEAYRVGGKLRTFPRICSEYVRVMRNVKPDMVVCFLPEPCLIALLMNHRVKAVLVGSERGNPFFQYRSKIYRRLMEFTYRRLDGVVFQTQGAREFFSGKVWGRSTVIGNPVNDRLAQMRCTGPKEKKIVSVGRFTYEKNYPMLLRAFARVHGQLPEYKLHIFGRVEESLGIRELVAELGLQDAVVLEGQTDAIYEQICDAEIYVLSSLSEGMPNALMEAMGLGLAVIATDCPSGGPRQLIRHGENGLLVENDNEDEMADAMLYLLNNKVKAEEMAENAKRIVETYSLRNIVSQWKQYLDEVYRTRRTDK